MAFKFTDSLRTLRKYAAVVMAALLCIAAPVQAERLKELASIQGVRDNPLIGYGLVVGLDGTGDQTMQTPFTTQSLNNMLSQLGMSVEAGTKMQLKNVAAVMVTATLPPFARPGQTIDITVSSMGNAKSLRGGTLLMTPLKGSDGMVYAVAQGNMVVGGAGASANGSRVQVNQLSSGRIPAGALVERAVAAPLGGAGNSGANSGVFMLELKATDFGTAKKAVDALNRHFGNGTAQALDARVIQVNGPTQAEAQVGFLAQVENLDVTPEQAPAKVIINARTGSVVMNQAVKVLDFAVAHGNLSVTINTQPVISQPNPLSGGSTVVTQASQIELHQGGGAMQVVKAGASLAEIVKGLNRLGANPQDLVSILQAMKASGALRAELEVI